MDPVLPISANAVVLQYDWLEPETDDEVIRKAGSVVTISNDYGVTIRYDALRCHAQDQEWDPGYTAKIVMKGLGENQLKAWVNDWSNHIDPATFPKEHELFLHMDPFCNLSKVLHECRNLAKGINTIKLHAYGDTKVKLRPGDEIDILV